MPVYLVQAGEGGPVKIGHAEAGAIISRLGTIQTNNHVPLVLMRVLDGDRRLEATLHQHFGHLHLHHEWFAYAPEMEGDLGAPEWLPAATLHKPWPIMEKNDPALRTRLSASRKRLWADPTYRQMMADAYGTSKSMEP